MTVSETLWEERQSRWRGYYARRLGQALHQAIEFVRTSRSVEELRSHYDSLLTLIRQGWQWSKTQALAVQLTAALVPWPERWSEWVTWEPALRVSLDLSRKLRDESSRAVLLTSLGWTYFRTGRHDLAADAGQEALEIATQQKLSRTLAAAGSLLINILVYRADYAKAVERLQDVESLLRAMRPFITATAYQQAFYRLQLNAVYILRRQGRSEVALHLSQQITRRLQEFPAADPYLLADALMAEGVMLWVAGYYPLSAEATQDSLVGFARLGNAASVAELHGNLGLIYWSMGRFDVAESQLQCCIRQTERTKALWQLLRCVGDLGLTYLAQNRLEESLTTIERHIELAQLILDEPEVIRGIGNRGAVWYHLGEYDKAIADLQEDLRHRSVEATPSPLVMSSVNLGRVYRALRREAQAYAYVMQALDVAVFSDLMPLRILAYRALAEYPPRWRQEQLLKRVIRLSAALHRHFDEAAGWLSLAAVTPQARLRHRYWQTGVHLLDFCGATRWLAGHNEHHPPQLPLIV